MQSDFSNLNGVFPEPIPRVILIAGTDDGLKSEALHLLVSKVVDPEFADIDREEIDIPHTANSESLGREIISMSMGMPMFSERRVIVVTNIQRLNKEDQDALVAGIERLGERSCLVLVAGTPEFDSGKIKAKSVASAVLIKAVDKAGLVLTCNAPNENDLFNRAHALVKAAGKTIDSAGLEQIIHQSKAAAADRGGGGKSGDLNVLRSELEKAILYVGDRPKITEADVSKVCGRAAIENIFALTDAVGNRNAPRALDALDELLRTGEKPDRVAARVIVMLARQIRLVWGALAIGQSKGGDLDPYLSNEMSGLAARQGYLLRSLQDQARRWTPKELEAAQRKILSYDLELKGISVEDALGEQAPAANDPSSLLKMLTVELCGPARTPRR